MDAATVHLRRMNDLTLTRDALRSDPHRRGAMPRPSFVLNAWSTDAAMMRLRQTNGPNGPNGPRPPARADLGRTRVCAAGDAAVSVGSVEPDELLSGGNASGLVIRSGATVRKVWTRSTPSVVSFIEFLRACGVDAPEPQGRDGHGRQVLEFVPGTVAMDAGQLSHTDLGRVGALVRSIHDAAASFQPAPDSIWQTAIAPPGEELVCHNDLAPWNLIIGERWVFIDWDASAPSTRLWDLAYSAQSFAIGDPHQDAGESAERLAAFVDGYGANDELRRALPRAMRDRVRAMQALLDTAHREGREPWATMFVEGHGAHWGAVYDVVERHQDRWVRALT